MNWSDERYVRVYTRDTVSWMALDWQHQALFLLLLRKVDRVGAIDLGRSGARGLAALVRMPVDVVEAGLQALLDDGCLEMHGSTVMVPNFIEAQEATMSPTARQQEHRLRRRDQIRAGIDPGKRGTVVYFVQSEHGGEVKIGHADDLAKRLVGLNTSRPDRLVVIGAFPATLATERRLHDALAEHRVKGEWFNPAAAVMAAAQAAAVDGATEDSVIAAACHGASDVTNRDASRNVRGHSVPYLAVPSLAVPEDQDRPVEPPQLELVASEPTVDVAAVHDAAYAAYPASRRTGKAKGLEALRASVRTPDDAERFARVVAAHLASASEDKFVRHWERICSTWTHMPDVAPARASPDPRRGSVKPLAAHEYPVGDQEI